MSEAEYHDIVLNMAEYIAQFLEFRHSNRLFRYILKPMPTLEEIRNRYIKQVPEEYRDVFEFELDCHYRIVTTNRRIIQDINRDREKAGL